MIPRRPISLVAAVMAAVAVGPARGRRDRAAPKVDILAELAGLRR